MTNLLNKIGTMIFKFLLVILAMTAVTDVSAQEKSAEEYFKEAELLYRNFDYNEAIPFYDKAIELDPANPTYYLQRGFCKNITKDFDGAVSDFSALIDLSPGNGFAYVSRGSALNKMERYEEAMEDFNKALEIDPKDQEAYNNRGFSKKGLGDKDGACKDWKSSRKLGNEEAKLILKNNYCK